MPAEDYRSIPLYRRDGSVAAVALVDLDDFDGLAEHRWHLGSNGYARRNVRGQALLMHRVILEVGVGEKVDHINRARLDNRRPNLRIASQAQNAQNRAAVPDTSSRYRGVWWESSGRCWRARACLDNKRYTLGRFDSELDAAMAVERWRLKYMPFAEPDPRLSS